MRLLLVNPPYAPSTPATLGIALMSAIGREEGWDVTERHWNLRAVQEIASVMPIADAVATYDRLTSPGAFPYNEWVYRTEAFGEDLKVDVLGRMGLEKALESGDLDELALRALLTLRSHAQSMVRELAEEAAEQDVVGIASTFYQNVASIAFAREVKRRKPNVKVVIGGANCRQPMAAALFNNVVDFDAVFVGEADESFREYLRAMAEGVPPVIGGVLSRDGKSSGALVGVCRDLNHTPTPVFQDWVDARQNLGLNQVQKLVLPLETSRGCWWAASQQCNFCGLNADQPTQRVKSLARASEQVSEVSRNYSPSMILMTDNILPRQWEGGEIKSFAAQTQLFYEVRAHMSDASVAALAEANVGLVQVGVESFDSDLLRLMNKGVRSSTNVKFLREAAENGITTTYNVICDLPNEEDRWYERMAQKIGVLHHLRPFTLVGLQYHRYSPYFESAQRFGLELRPHWGYDFLYPWAVVDRGLIASQFERVEEYTPIFERPVFLRLSEALASWRRDFSSGCMLIQSDKEAGILIEDTRPGFGPNNYVLHGLTADVLHLLEEPRSVEGIVRRVSAKSRCAGEYEVRTAISELESLGLVFQDELDGSPTRWVSVALREGRLPRIDFEGLIGDAM